MVSFYKVGGYVRDKLLERECNDIDWEVNGATIEYMISKGFKQVGKDFPVFLHPYTKEEYALSRIEKPIGHSHKDFVFDFNPNIKLIDSLKRRDFTINAMVEDENGVIIDYFNGRKDLKKRILRAIRPETFIEDPLRVLRGCRFASQLDFEIDKNTMKLFKHMVKNHMLEYLTPERIWKETEKALTKGYNSSKYFNLLEQCGALKILFPEIYNITLSPEQTKYHPSGNTFKHTMIALNRVKNCSSIIKFAILCHDLGKGNTPKEILPKHIDHDKRGVLLIDKLCDNIKVPNEYRNFAKMFCKEHMRISKLSNMSLKKKYDLIKYISNNYKDEQLLNDFLLCFSADWNGEDILTEYNNPEQLNNIILDVKNIFNIMKNIGLKDLSPATQSNLSRYKGEKFGILYREELIKYLKQKLNERKIDE